MSAGLSLLFPLKRLNHLAASRRVRAAGTIACCLLFASLGWGSVAARGAAPEVNYGRDIKPILSGHCYACHGPDANKRKAELRLDDSASAYVHAIKPGDPAASEMISRITSTAPEQKMPPVDSKIPPLSDTQIDLLRRWIAAGARFDAHWSYLPPLANTPPQVDAAIYGDGPIDQFIGDSLIAAGLPPAPLAEPRTLLRRLSFDLTGLPPSAGETAAFIADSRGEAYEAAVNRLLESPRYGERMAMFWLDLVRYADTNGIHGDNHQDVSPFRDYVIRAFNENMPFDQFTREQLAGDLLPRPTNWQKIASGYNRLLMTTREGGAQAKEYMAKYSADRVRNFSSVWLGSTMGCCECHDHKYDPFLTRDFYRLESFFADIQEVPVGEQPATRIPFGAAEEKAIALSQRMDPLKGIMATSTPELEAAQAEWEKVALLSAKSFSPLVPATLASTGGTTLTAQGDGSILASGSLPDRDSYTLNFKTSLKHIKAIRVEVLPDPSLPQQGPGRGSNGNFVLSEVRLTAAGQPVALANATASYSQEKGEVTLAIDGDPATGWGIFPQVGKANQAVFETQSDVGGGEEIELVLALDFNFGLQHAIGKLRVSATSAPRPVKADDSSSIPAEINDILTVDVTKRSDEQRAKLSAYYRSIAPLLAEPRSQLAELQAKYDALIASIPPTLVSVAGEPRTIRVLPRGNWLDESGEAVVPGVPGFLPQLPPTDRRMNRLDLAEWSVRRDNPLVARVFVNRLWKLLFGQGLVRTMEDFGTQGDFPVQRQLLDWLAVDFINHGYDVKRTIKQIVMSRTYRRSSTATAEQKEKDPLNLNFARQNRFRLEAEMLRDNALSVSGLLVEKVGGPSVKPYQPAGYWAHLNFPVREWQSDHGESLYRRGLYTYWCRTFLHPSMVAFDAPSREECAANRARSSTPQQALVLLNDPTYVECARIFAERIVLQGGPSPAERIQFAYQEALGRAPRQNEIDVLTQLQAKHLVQYAQDEAAAKQLLTVGERPANAAISAPELAAWTSVARTILNLNETISRD